VKKLKLYKSNANPTIQLSVGSKTRSWIFYAIKIWKKLTGCQGRKVQHSIKGSFAPVSRIILCVPRLKILEPSPPGAVVCRSVCAAAALFNIPLLFHRSRSLPAGPQTFCANIMNRLPGTYVYGWSDCCRIGTQCQMVSLVCLSIALHFSRWKKGGRCL